MVNLLVGFRAAVSADNTTRRINLDGVTRSESDGARHEKAIATMDGGCVLDRGCRGGSWLWYKPVPECAFAVSTGLAVDQNVCN